LELCFVEMSVEAATSLVADDEPNNEDDLDAVACPLDEDLDEFDVPANPAELNRWRP
jgi:hypothetical protein